MPVGLPSSRQLVGLVVGHQGGIVEESHLADNGHGVLAEVPRRSPHPYRTYPGDALQRIRRPHLKITLLGWRQPAAELVDPPVNADFVPRRNDLALLVGIEHRHHRGDEEGGGDTVAGEHREDARHRHPVAVLPLGKLARRGVPGAKGQRLVVGVERERHRNPGTVLPRRRLERSPRPDSTHDRAPPRLLPPPGFFDAGDLRRQLHS